MRDQFLAEKGCKDLAKVPDEFLEEWQATWARNSRYSDVEFRPLAAVAMTIHVAKRVQTLQYLEEEPKRLSWWSWLFHD